MRFQGSFYKHRPFVQSVNPRPDASGGREMANSWQLPYQPPYQIPSQSLHQRAAQPAAERSRNDKIKQDLAK